MISATSTASALSAYTPAASSDDGDVQRVKMEINATKAEIAGCDCEDTKKKLELELRNLQAELASAKAKENGPNANDNELTSAGNGSDQGNPYQRPSFSGESDRIGTRNFDENTPFGERVAYL